MRVFVVGDIHGGLKGLLQVLNKIEITDKDQLIFLGDYVDGWSESAQVVNFLINLSKEIQCVFIKGNHDIWCENWLKDNNDVNPSWYLHGGKETIESYHQFSKDEKKNHLKFFESMKMYHLDANNRLFLHAGFTSLHGVEREAYPHNFCTDRTLWEMVIAMDENLTTESSFYPKRLQLYNEIYIGHTPTTNYKINEPVNRANLWNIDTGAAFTGKISIMNIENKEFWQSDNLPSLYPNEKGRNK